VKAAEKVKELKEGLKHKGEYFKRGEYRMSADTSYKTL
jgi:hypothetical protein